MSTNYNFWRERKAEADSNRGPSTYQPNALPLGQTGSLWRWRKREIIYLSLHCHHHRVQELCDSRSGRPGLSVLTSLMVSVDVKHYWTMLTHWSQLVPNTSTRHPRTWSSTSSSSSSPSSSSSWCHHQNDSCIKMGSDESYFNVSVGSDGQSQDSVHKPQPFWRERRAEAVSNRGPSAYQPNALPLGQIDSQLLFSHRVRIEHQPSRLVEAVFQAYGTKSLTCRKNRNGIGWRLSQSVDSTWHRQSPLLFIAYFASCITDRPQFLISANFTVSRSEFYFKAERFTVITSGTWYCIISASTTCPVQERRV